MADGSALLEVAVAALLAEDPAGFSGQAALARVGTILRLQQQLEVAALAGIADVDAREAFVHAACGSTRDWLRTQVAGDGGRLGRAQRWAQRPTVREAVAAGRVGIAGADSVCGALGKIEELSSPVGPGGRPQPPVGEDQVHGVLLNAVPELLCLWLGQGVEPAERTEQQWERRSRLAEVLTEAANAPLAQPADRLEPVLSLLAEALAPSNLARALEQIVDALQPERLDAQADELAEQTFLRFVRRPGLPGRRIEGLIDDEGYARYCAKVDAYRRQAGLLAQQQAAEQAELTALLAAAAAEAEAEAEAEVAAEAEVDAPDADAPDADAHDAADAQDDGEIVAPEVADEGAREPVLPFPGPAPDSADPVAAAFGAVGPGLPLRPLTGYGGVAAQDLPVEGTPVRDKAQSELDAFLLMIDDLPDAAPGSRVDQAPRPVQITIIGSEAAFHGRAGALPMVMETRTGPIRIAPEAARRLACDGVMSGLRLDQDGKLIDASGEHRHANRAQRRALKAHWGSLCAVNGCTQPGVVPHHVRWFSKGGLTVLSNLVPVCLHHHHDLHEGHRTLRLRDDRLIGADGWVTPHQRAA